MTDMAAQRADLRSAIGQVVDKAGYDLEGVSVARVGRRSLVRVTVDADGGLDLDAIAEISRQISAALDDPGQSAGVVAGPYTLEVSTPGVDRPLTEHRHWRRNVGRLVRVHAGDRTFTGRVRDVSATAVAFDTDGVRHEVPFDELGPGHVQVEFGKEEA